MGCEQFCYDDGIAILEGEVQIMELFELAPESALVEKAI